MPPPSCPRTITPPCPRPIIVPTTKQPKCNCELCSATVGKPKKNPCYKNPSKTTCPSRSPSRPQNFDDIPCIKPVKSTGKHDCGVVPANEPSQEPPETSHCCSRNSRRQENEEEDWPCHKKKQDIIRRNKLAVKILSKQLQAVKSLAPPCCDSRYEPIQLFPTAKHAMRWAPAYSLARSRSQTCAKKKKKPAPKKPIDVTEKNRTNCACEVMANAIREDMTHHLGLSEQRKTINETPQASPSKASEEIPEEET